MSYVKQITTRFVFKEILHNNTEIHSALTHDIHRDMMSAYKLLCQQTKVVVVSDAGQRCVGVRVKIMGCIGLSHF